MPRGALLLSANSAIVHFDLKNKNYIIQPNILNLSSKIIICVTERANNMFELTHKL